MRNVFAIGRREILSFFVSPTAYFVITGFVLLGGYFFFNLLGIFNLVIEQYQQMAMMRGGLSEAAPNLNQWVVEGFYQTLLVILVFMVPLLTMRTIAEEKRRGTFELLVTSPVSVREIVLGKFVGVGFVVFLMMLFVFAFPALLMIFGNPEVAPIFSGILAVTMCTLGFVSVGMAISALTENQVVAGISTMVALLLLYVIHSPAESIGGTGAAILNALSPVMQARDLLHGVVTLSGLVYFASLILFGLFLAERALEAHRWR